jgi:ABC-2 type transport system permease protein
VVGLFVRLKLRLIRNGLRGGWQRKAGLIVGAIMVIPAAILGFAVLALARLDDAGGRQLAVIGFTMLFVSWISLPILGFGSDETLDPSRLALLPLTRRQLMTGLLSSSLIGLAPLGTLIALSGSLIGFTTSVASALIVGVAVVVELALCICGSRAVVTALSRVLRSRRGRDLSLVLVALFALIPQLFRLATPDMVQGRTVDFAPLAASVRWIPPGMAGQAMADARDGRLGHAVAEITVAAVAVLVLLAMWGFWLERALTSADASSGARPAPTAPTGAAGAAGGATPRAGAPGRPLFPSAVRSILPLNRTGAVAARELRYLMREPRRRVQVLYGFLMPVFIGLPALARGELRHPPAVLGSLAVAFFLGGLTALNQLGVDGAAYWTNVAAGNDPRADLMGKNLATALSTMPAVIVTACLIAAYNGGWVWVPVAIALALAMLGVELGVGNVVSVLAPQAMPESIGNMWAQRSGQGCATGFITLLALAVEVALLVPVAVMTAAGMVWHGVLIAGAPLAVLYGYGLWRVGLTRAERRVWWRLPELLEAVSPKAAA